MYGEKFIEELKNRIVLSDVIGKKLTIIHKGRNKLALCPFHHEKTPSFNIDDEKGFYHCFGCGKSGDAINFLTELEGLTFKESVERLAEEYNITLPKIEKTQQQIKYESEIDVIYRINEESCKFFEKNIFENSGKIALDYIYKRGLKLEDLKLFRIGYSLNSFSALHNHLKNLGFKDMELQKAGVISEGSNGFYDKFRNRVMFPVFDKKGRIIAFTGRVLDDSMPKYMNSPETLIYHKSDVLFNYFHARKFMYEKNKVILVEGNLDAISLFINGVENVVAPMGTATTLKQIEELWRGCDEIIVCFDGDNAGQKAMNRLSKMILPILSPKKMMKFVILPQEEDPDSYIKNFGKKAFANYVKNNSFLLSEFLINNILKELSINTNDGCVMPEKHNVLEIKLDDIIKEIKNSTVSKNFNQYFKNELWNLFKFKKSNKRTLYSFTTNINYNKQFPQKGTIAELDNSIKILGKRILNYLLFYPEFIDRIFKNYNIDILSLNFSDVENEKLKNTIINLYEKNLLNNANEVQIVLEKNDLNNYIRLDSSINYDANNEENLLKNVYILIIELSEMFLIRELKILSINNDNEIKRKQYEAELDKLIDKKEKFRNLNNL